MRVGMPLKYSGGFTETVADLRDFEAAGLDLVMLPEAYSFDSVSQLGYLAARTSTVLLATSILNIYSRTPALLAMTAAGLDYVSDGRFVLGLGASGPQVIEGFHGVRYDAPLGRTREVVEICRAVWRREPLSYDGRHYHLPLDAAHGGSGLGKPLKLINHPVRSVVPIVLAALGPGNVELAAEIGDGWEPIFYLPEAAPAAFGASLAAGRARRASTLGPLDVVVPTQLLISEDAEEIEAAVQAVREHLALYVGGMGARGRNFYNELAGRYGFAAAAAEVQDHYLAGRKAQAAAAVPERLVRGVSLIGPPGYVRERVAAFAESGVTTLNGLPLAGTHRGRLADVERLKEYASSTLPGTYRDRYNELTN
ncbi:LLM class F420-dependent oxidoreductase [Parafrankia sp. BMG5.11]|uniref:LLM class F420-dependent oxidoreductase n=2 Tax=unclassified Parafrankia TaxID=2994368 RepID=UPI000DA436A8|nr:LLM class F420-dependent oxidoreductase [Parafrankia sp. BMG5.11]TCJ40047.1 LLM class F420-dependent oxidoreductase [Parafrankia sp. BMG5.11]SQD95980.1 putative enzyme [Parafrankia sp. Ea1.12]